MIVLVFVIMFITWCGTNPLRVTLMFLCGFVGYLFVILTLTVVNKKYKNNNIKNIINELIKSDI